MARLSFIVLVWVGAILFPEYAYSTVSKNPSKALKEWLPEHVESMKPGLFRVKVTKESIGFFQLLTEADFSKTLITNNLALDAAHLEFGVAGYESTFQPLYNTKGRSGEFQHRHQQAGLDRWFDLMICQTSDPLKFIRELSQLPEIETVEPVLEKILVTEQFAYPDSISDPNPKEELLIANDQYFTFQWALENTGQHGGLPGADIRVRPAWELSTGNPDVIIAVIDGGIQITHPDLQANIWEGVGYNFADETEVIIPHNHGTHVAGIIAAQTNNATGISGIAGGWGDSPGVQLMSLQVFASHPSGNTQGGFHLAPVFAADNGAAISQNSWSYTQANVYEQVVLDAIDYFNTYGGGEALREGGITIFAAGNNGAHWNYYPAAYSGTLSVAATNHLDKKAIYSNYGPTIDLAAPGGEITANNNTDILSTWTTGSGYNYTRGTSMACPQVTGVAALMISYDYGKHTPARITEWLKAGADDISEQNPTFPSSAFGAGRLNAHASMSLLEFFRFEVSRNQENHFPNISWQQPALENIAGYNIYRDSTLIAQLDHMQNHYTDTLTEAYKTYYYTISVLTEEEEFKSPAGQEGMAIPPQHAEAHIWTGQASDQWENPINWLNYKVPAGDADVLIPPGREHYPLLIHASSKDTTPDNLFLKDLLLIDEGSQMEIGPGVAITVTNDLVTMAGSNGLIIHSDSTGYGSLIHYSESVNATVERYIGGEPWSWHQLAVPLEGQSTDIQGGEDGILFAWSEPLQNWISSNSDLWSAWIDPENLLQAGRGYMSAFGNNPTLEYHGGLIATEHHINLSRKAHESDPFKGFNLVGNPYTAAIDWKNDDAWEGRSNLAEESSGYNIYIWNNNGSGNYGVYSSASINDHGTLGVSRYIPPMQAFWVKAAEDESSLTVKPEARIHSNQPWVNHKNNNSMTIRMHVQGAGNAFFDECILEFGHNQNNGGVKKLFSMYEEAPAIYAGDSETPLAIMFTGSSCDQPPVLVGFKAGVSGKYRLRLSGLDSFDKEIWLHDLFLGEIILMEENKSYDFQALTSDPQKRFELHIGKQNATHVAAISHLNANAFYANGLLNVHNPFEDTLHIQVFNLSGNLIDSFGALPNSLTQQSFMHPQGVYLVRMDNGNRMRFVNQ
jgi:subtilisin family serine protease